jgi:hypothetical protein
MHNAFRDVFRCNYKGGHYHYFLEHLEYLLLQQMNPVAKAGYFGVLFDKAPTYEEIKFGTPKTAAAIELNRLFSLKINNDVHLAGANGRCQNF